MKTENERTHDGESPRTRRREGSSLAPDHAYPAGRFSISLDARSATDSVRCHVAQSLFRTNFHAETFSEKFSKLTLDGWRAPV